jgi:hypothetical protein
MAGTSRPKTMMTRMNQKRRAMGPGARLAVLAFSGLFALVFGLGGFFAGLQPLYRTLKAAWEVQGWQPVPAEVLASELQTSRGSKSTTYRVNARYRYTFAGTTYEGSRVGLDDSGGSDNVGDWHPQWQARLQAARSGGRPITAWVDPQQPSSALLDRSIRWVMLVFHLPFALVFTAVGLGAAWMFWRTLVPPASASDAAAAPPLQQPSAAPRSSASRSQGRLWFFAFFWCGITFPLAAVFWMSGSPWWVNAFTSVFVVVGLALVYVAMRQSVTAWRFAGVRCQWHPAQPRAGQRCDAALRLKPRAAAARRHGTATLRLAQYRVDDAGSGSTERLVESFDRTAALVPEPDGGVRLAAQFELPDDAPAHGARRSRERVDWRLEVLRDDGTVEVSYDVPVQAVAQAAVAPDRFAEPPDWGREITIGAASGTDAAAAWPRHVRVMETQDHRTLSFSQRGWRWAAVAVLVPLALLVQAWWRDLPADGWRFVPLGVLLAFVVHASTRRWTLTVRDAGLAVTQSSWMWRRVRLVPGEATASLFHKVLYASGSQGQARQTYHAVYARVRGEPQAVQLTPGLAGADGAVAVARAIADTWTDRTGRFSAGAARPRDASSNGPQAGWLACGVLLAGLWASAGLVPGATAGGRDTWEDSLRPADSKLVTAQDAGDAAGLERALREGADANLLNARGSSMLMLAAHRGQLAHVELLLRHGATPDLRQTRSDNERGDTALLRAFHGGHLEVAQRLVQAGASLQVRNRWDWGPVHMAAQSGCVPCLQWLAEQGLALDEPAVASRGETPLMLAAANGRIEALAWFEARGQDLWTRDPHGHDALGWARFGHQTQAEQWLLARQPPR